MTWWPWLHPNLLADPNRGHFARGWALFTPTPQPLRTLTAVVDAGLLQSATRDKKVQYLLELLAAAPISAHLYADDGPPANARRLIACSTGVEAVEGWVSIRPGEREGRPIVAYVKDRVPISAVALADDPVFLHLSQAPASGVSPDQVRADAMALLVANTMRADFFVTERQLAAHPESSFWRTTVMTPGDALPAVGLYLRQQGRFLLGRTPALGAAHAPEREARHDRGAFFWHAAETLLPAARGWAIACRTYTEDTGENTLSSLPLALTQRVYQALRSRDRLLAALSVPQDNDTNDDALNELDQILLWLMAAFDITAQVAHVALGLPRSKARNAKWQHPGWRASFPVEGAALADLVSNENEGEHVLTIVTYLRNSIHREALSAGGTIFVVGNQAMNTLVDLPDKGREKVFSTMEALGGHAAWGAVEPFPGDGLRLRPGDFVEQLLPRALTILNSLVAATPLERLDQADTEAGQPSGTIPRGPREERSLWQLGL